MLSVSESCVTRFYDMTRRIVAQLEWECWISMCSSGFRGDDEDGDCDGDDEHDGQDHDRDYDTRAVCNCLQFVGSTKNKDLGKNAIPPPLAGWEGVTHAARHTAPKFGEEVVCCVCFECRRSSQVFLSFLGWYKGTYG